MDIGRNSILIPIDIQKGFMEGKYSNRNNPDLESNVSKLMQYWRRSGGSIIHVRHDSMSESSPLKAGKPGFQFFREAQPLGNEAIITKHVHSAFLGTELLEMLKSFERPELYFMGIATDHCVSTSVRMASDYGFNTSLIYDACAAFDRKSADGSTIGSQLVHDSAIASLKGEFCKVLYTKDIIY